ncbi:MAG TPA: glycosyltransferase family 4 protein [Terracidiphilus sp.]|jgi:glycosyltransferase involved in cell wall biosynthesis
MQNIKALRTTRVLFIDHTAQLGGGEIALRNLIAQFDPEQTCAIVLLCEEGPLAAQLEEHHQVHILPISARVAGTRKDTVGWKSLLRVKEVYSVLSLAFRMAHLMREIDVHVVHTNSLKSHVIGGLAAKIARRPLVWHLRDRIAPDYLPRPAVLFVRTLGRLLPNYVIANSQATLDTLIDPRSGTASPKRKLRSRVVHDGCSVPAEVASIKPNGPARIGLIGRISPWKGQHIFIKAAALIRPEFPDVQFQVIGAALFSENDYESSLKALCRDLGMEDRVAFLGFVSDVQGAIAQLEIVVHASTVGEPFGQVVIEGMAAGKPVIATRGGGIPEIVVDKTTGLLVPAGDERALADAMATMLRDPAKALEMGRRGRDRVKECFTIERTARAVEQVYRDVVRVYSADLSRHEAPAEAMDLKQ